MTGLVRRALRVTGARREVGHEPPEEATVEIRAPRAAGPGEHPAQWAQSVAELQAEEAERLAEVLADTLPEGTLQRLVGFILVRTAGARMGVAPLGDARAQYGDRAELDRVRTILEGAWGPGEISKGHPLHVLAAQVVDNLARAQRMRDEAALTAATQDAMLRGWLADLERAQNVADVGDVTEAMRRRLGLPPCGSPNDTVHARPAGLRGQTCPDDDDHPAHVWTSTLVEAGGERVWCLGQPPQSGAVRQAGGFEYSTQRVSGPRNAPGDVSP